MQRHASSMGPADRKFRLRVGAGRHRSQNPNCSWWLEAVKVGTGALTALVTSATFAISVEHPPGAGHAPLGMQPTASVSVPLDEQLATLDLLARGLHDPSSVYQHDALAALQSKIILNRHMSSVVRTEALRRVAGYLKQGIFTKPSDTASFCVSPTPRARPANLQFALNVLGDRLAADIPFRLDLSATNLGFAHLENLDLRNIDFSTSLLCRAFLTSSRLDGATFLHANLESSDLRYSSATTSQLLAASTLRGASVPAKLRQSLRNRIMTDPLL